MTGPRANRKSSKSTSEPKLAANRRNAKRSTGPKNTSKTRYNALKHGLLSQAAIIERGDLEEDRRELAALVKALLQDFEPAGAMEEALVDVIASCYWRRRRAMRAEVGAIRLDADTTVYDVIRARGEKFLRSINYESLSTGMTGSWQEMITTSHGIQRLRDILAEFQALVAEQGFLLVDQLKKVARVFGRQEDSFGDLLVVMSTIAAEQSKPEGDEKDWSLSPEACKRIMLKRIDEELKSLDGMEEEAAEREHLEIDSTALSRHLPNSGALENINRYVTTIDREMYRALNELKALQAARREGRIGRSR